MDVIFLKIVNMSITAGWIVLAVVVLRALFRKAPKWIRLVLWGFVALRLICPISIESVFSLMPSGQTLPSDMVSDPNFHINSGVGMIDRSVNDYLDDRYVEGVTVPVNYAKDIIDTLTVVWIAGVAVMLVYAIVSYLRVKKQVREAVVLEENVWLCDQVTMPFILGMIRTRIYLPSSMEKEDMSFVISHENAHLKRGDYIWKPFGFLLLTVYWFNPILWLGYVLLCRDIELACDERVLKEMGNDLKKPYAEALINCSVPRKTIAACPLAFGENGVKQRVKTILNYRKPAFWIVIVFVLVCIVVGVCMLTNPQEESSFSIDELVGESRIYKFQSEKDIATLTISPQDSTFTFTYSVWSSYHAVGTYGESNDYLIMQTDDGKFKYSFQRSGENLRFVADLSSPIPGYRYSPNETFEIFLVDGALLQFVGTEVTGSAEFYYDYDSSIETAGLSLRPGNKRCHFYTYVGSSAYPLGTYEESGRYVIVKLDEERGTYTFQKKGKNLIFVADKSSPLERIPDGAVFKMK